MIGGSWRAPLGGVLVGVVGLFAAGGGLAVAAQGSPPSLERFTVRSDGHPMAVWARRPDSPRAAVLLVHGRTWSSRPDFDLLVPGLQRSVMASLAARGLAAYAVDLRGYGETRRDSTGWMTPRRGAADILNVLAWIADQHPSLPRPALVGWSRGAAMSLLVAQAGAERLSALVVFGFAYDPDLQFADAETPARPAMTKNTAAAAASDFMSPRVTPKAVVEAFVAQALRSDPTLVDLRNDREFNAIDPARITVPTLLLYGERDPNVTAGDAARLLDRLGASRKAAVALAGADHAAQLEDTHDAWITAVTTFVARPDAPR
jgi:pimeloyl-ACP methyl ester carboxylesterase